MSHLTDTDAEGLRADLSKATAREQKLLKVIEKNLGETEATRAITEAGGSALLLLPHVLKEIRVIEEGDDFKAIVVAKDGKTPRIKNGSGDPMTIEALVAEFKTRPSYGDAFEVEGAGSGKPRVPTHKISRADAKDNRKYVAAKAAADEAGVELEIDDSAPSVGRGNSRSAYKLSLEDAKDHRKYAAAKEAAEKAGLPLEITE